MFALKHGVEDQVFRLDFGLPWAGVASATYDVRVDDELVVEGETATIGGPYTLASEVARHASQMTIAFEIGGSNEVVAGDKLYIASSADGPAEVVTVHRVGTANLLYLVRETEYGHASGTAVTCMHATSEETDLSDYDAGTEVLVSWYSDTTETPVHMLYQIMIGEMSTSWLWDQMRVLYPVEWERIRTQDLVQLEAVILDDFRAAFAPYNPDKVLDAAVVRVGLLKRARLLILSAYGDADAHEYEVAKEQWSEWSQRLLGNTELWEDKNQDLEKDEGEQTIRPWVIREYSV